MTPRSSNDNYEEAREYPSPPRGERKSRFLDELTRDETRPGAADSSQAQFQGEPQTIQQHKKGEQDGPQNKEEEEEDDDDDLAITLTELRTNNPSITFSRLGSPIASTFTTIPLTFPLPPSRSSHSSDSERLTRRNSFDLIFAQALENEDEAQVMAEVRGLIRRSVTPPGASTSIAEVPRAWRKGDGGRGRDVREEGFEMVDLEAGRDGKVGRKRAKTVEEEKCSVM
ncbi:hypothetical protein TI39_contig481g00032 [Zymoseptoria brevis]|uniref:Uncharacterized protein n=1 Tax=Zymoseptoria brevis TaxID=1047168 RepID=A0A0F4GJY0_9PEZI|nr:hypothetical protein TI39_contig481g00032 [Zymoseptoria brevis]